MLKSFGKVFSGGVLGVVGVLAISAVIKNYSVNETSTSIVPATATTVTVTPIISNNNVVKNSSSTNNIVLLKPGNEEQLIIFNTPVVHETVQAAISHLEALKAKGYKEAFLILDSPGGSVFDGARLLAWINDSPMKVNTICDGLCASMAAHLFEVGKTRYMTNKSTLMFHPASGGVMGTLEQMASRLNYVQTYVDRLDANIAARAGMDYKEFKQRTLVEYWVETEDAISSKLADSVVFISYDRAANGSLNMEDRMRKLNKIIPDKLKTPGILLTESVRLPDVN